MNVIRSFYLLMAVLSLSCKNNYEFDTIASTCPTTLEVNISLNELAEKYDGEVFQIQEDWIVE
ncbi:MAG: hypothetical protein AAFQ20_09755, partial [Bacteroidota bacterium]